MEEVNLGKYGKLYLIQETFHLLLMMILILNPLKKLIGDPKGQINYFWLTLNRIWEYLEPTKLFDLTDQ